MTRLLMIPLAMAPACFGDAGHDDGLVGFVKDIDAGKF